MSVLEHFNFHGSPVRVIVDDDGEPRWVASDVAKILGYRMASDMARRLDSDEKGTRSVRTPGGAQEVTVITESGLYVAVLGSKAPGAREFKRWVTREVLPAIRRHGGYMTPEKVQQVLTDPDTIIQLATQLKEERARATQAELEARRNARRLEAQAPQVAKAKAHSAVTEWKRRQDFYREVQQWGDTVGATIKQHDVATLLARKGMLIGPGRSDSGQVKRAHVAAGHGQNRKGVSENGYAYVTPVLSPKGQDLAWKWIVEARGEFGDSLNPQKEKEKADA